jgi:hypothetical protein
MGSVASQDSDLGPRAASKAEVEVPIEAELVDEEVHSKSTATDDLFPRSAGSASETAAREHQLGLDINYPWGWGGSKYNDYEYVNTCIGSSCHALTNQLRIQPCNCSRYSR